MVRKIEEESDDDAEMEAFISDLTEGDEPEI